MKISAIICALIFLGSVGPLLGKDGRALRLWTSKKGTKVVARVVQLDDQSVTLRKRGGAEIILPLSKFIEEDQSLIKSAFQKEFEERDEPEPEPEPEFDDEEENEDEDLEDHLPEEDLPEEFQQGFGVFQGPIRASEGASYYVYLPTTLVKGQKAPLLFWTGHHKGKASTLDWMREGAELTGTVLAVSVESKNAGEKSLLNNLEYTKDCLKHISRKLPVETKWVFFAGNDRGAASALFNSDRFRCAGAFLVNGYIPRNTEGNGKGFYFVTTGTQNTNRYLAAKVVNTIGKDATFYPYAGNVRLPEGDVGLHGLIWLYTRHLYSMSRLRSSEVDRFEKRFKVWLKEHVHLSPWETLYYCQHLLITCDVEGEFRDFVLKIKAEVEEDPEAQNYMDARKAFGRFAEKVYAGYAALDVRLDKNHTTPKIEVEVNKLVEKFGEAPYFGELFELLAQPTVD